MKKIALLALLMLNFAAIRPVAAADPVAALMLFPQTVRNQMVVALKYPKVLLGLFDLRQRVAKEFRAAYQTWPKEAQQASKMLVPFPDLVRKLTELGKQGTSDAEAILKNYPAETHEPAKKLLKNFPQVLTLMDKVGSSAQQEFLGMVQSLPSDGQAAYAQLMRQSEIIKVMLEYLNVTPENVAGLMANPQSLDPQIKTLSQKLLQAANPKEPKLAASSGDNPQAMAELQKSANQENRELDYEMKVDPHPAGAVVATVGFTPYPYFDPWTNTWATPYWFGYWDWW